MMNFKKILFAGFALLAASCSNESEETVVKELAPVRVHVEGFKVSQESFARATRAADLSSVSAIGAITLAFYSGDTEEYKATQVKGSLAEGETFGDFSLSLPMGSHTMVVVAYLSKEGSPFVYTSATEAAYTGEHAYETFNATKTVTINSKDTVDVSAELNRIVSMLTVVSSDGKTANASNVRMTFSGGSRSFNPSTGIATDNEGFNNTVGISASVGATSTSITCLFLTADEQMMDVTIETLDALGNTLFSQKVENVPFRRNRKTKLTGVMYTNSKIGGSFKVNTDWIDEETVSF